MRLMQPERVTRPFRTFIRSLLALPAMLLVAALPAAAIEPLGGALTLGHDRLTMRVPVLPDRKLRGPSLNLRGALGVDRFRLDAEARLRRLDMGPARYDLRWLDLQFSHAPTERLRVGLYQTRFPTRLRAGHASSHRWRATGAMLEWTEDLLTLAAIAGRLDGNGGGRARELGLRAELAPGDRSRLGLMRNEVRGRSRPFRYTTTAAWAAHAFDFGLTAWVAVQTLRLRPGSDRLLTRSAGLAQRVALAGQPVILSVEASRTIPRGMPHRIEVVRVGLTVPLGTDRIAPLNSTLAALQRRPNFLFGYIDTVANGF